MDPSHAQNILQGALPGHSVPAEQMRRFRRRLPEAPWCFWRTDSLTWAVYVIAGGRLARTTTESVAAAAELGLQTVLVLNGPHAIAAVAPHYGNYRFHVACRVAGLPRLIPPVVPPSGPAAANTSKSRIQLDLVNELASSGKCPTSLRRSLRDLSRRYGSLQGGADDAEYAALKLFATSLFTSAGFKKASIPEMLRRLEHSGYGGRRDHFFHSFQNYFLGLFAVMNLPARFNLCQQLTRLNFNVDPLHVWFLTALWHDAGYGSAQLDVVVDDMLAGVGEQTAEYARAQFLRTEIVQEGRTVMASLMARMLSPNSSKTQWLEPRGGARRSSIQKQLEEAIEHNVVQRSHGAASALRLYAEYMPVIKRMSSADELVLRQMVYLACASMPFHDWSFRDAVREHSGTCLMGTDAMPFASLLAFVDSIQDDRRDLRGIRDQVLFLERLDVLPPARVSATVNVAALPPSALLGKLVEARDVLGSLVQSPGGLCFDYPGWMVA